MSFSPDQLSQLTESLRQSLGDNIRWQYEERANAMLSEFAQNKSSVIYHLLKQTLVDEWDHQSAKRLPPILKQELGTLAQVNKVQKILALSGNGDSPTMVALWWPWDHGGTYSLRIKLIEGEYDNTPVAPSSSALSWLTRLFARA